MKNTFTLSIFWLSLTVATAQSPTNGSLMSDSTAKNKPVTSLAGQVRL